MKRCCQEKQLAVLCTEMVSGRYVLFSGKSFVPIMFLGPNCVFLWLCPVGALVSTSLPGKKKDLKKKKYGCRFGQLISYPVN